MIQYGLISKVDGACIEKTIDLIVENFNDEVIYTTEIGIYNGQTSRGIHEYILSKGRKNMHTAIDNEKDKHILPPFDECNLFIGNSNEVCWRLTDNSQHLIFIDGCHCFAHVISDFFCYADKVKVDGYIAFHDTGRHIKQFKDFQHGDKQNPDAYISVRKALNKMGLLNDEPCESTLVYVCSDYDGGLDNWRLIFDEADPLDECGGICVFKKLY